MTLLEIKSSLNDSRNLLGNWQATDESPCKWTGISCHTHDQRVRSMYVTLLCSFQITANCFTLLKN